MMHKIYSLLFSLVLVAEVVAQDMSHLYAVGDAVPGGVQELVKFPNNQFKFAGTLKEGTLRIRNTLDHKLTTRYLKSSYEDPYIINNGLTYTLVRDSLGAEWTIPFTEDTYRFTVVYSTSDKTVTGELFRPWNELFVVGGATECGWKTYTFLPFTRDENEVCTWEWTGELKYRAENNEPRRFKFNGQNAWDPKVLHPFTSDENILKSTQILTNGNIDNKWSVVNDGYYHIVVDVFRETVHAEYLGQTISQAVVTDVPSVQSQDITIRSLHSQVSVTCQIPVQTVVYAADGTSVYSAQACKHEVRLPHQGLYIVRVTDGDRTFTRKVKW